MKKILINVNQWQTRIAVIRYDELQNIYFSSHAKHRLERSFFKGTIIKILPGIQTAFVNIGQEKAGFLHISEIDRELALQRMKDSVEFDDTTPSPVSQPAADISKIFKENEAILIQVSKEPVYEKGAKLTTCFTLPGRFIVLMPNIPRIAISKKIEDREERQRLKDLLKRLLPEGMGCIIRTTSEHRSEKDIKQDIEYLVGIWDFIQKKFKESAPQAKIYEDLPLTLQIVRDHLDDDVEAIICDDKKVQQEVYSFVKKTAPESTHKVKYYAGTQELFEKYAINKQIEQALSEKVHLKSGGSIIIETTQAMTVIDVNTSRYTGTGNLEDTILQTNLEAAEEIVHQLRLRNIGGIIVIDFIDMLHAANRSKLFKYFEKMLKERDKSQSVVLKLSEFNLVQMTRKRSGKTLLQELMESCPTCHGFGHKKTIQTICYHILPLIKKDLQEYKEEGSVVITLNPAMFEYIANVEYNTILSFEKTFNCSITLTSDSTIALDKYILS